MRVRARTASVAALIVLGGCTSCSRRNLEIGGGSIFVDAAAPAPDTADALAPPKDAVSGGADGTGGAGGAGAVIGHDAGGATCVAAGVKLPWAATPSAPLRLAVAVTAETVVRIRRQAAQARVRA